MSTNTTRTAQLYHRAARLPFGRRLFSQALRWAAPYFRTIPARIEQAEAGRVVVRMADRFRVHNHLGTVHAIAQCNLAELAMGLAAELTIPATHRWIPKSMCVEYLAKAKGSLLATARLDVPAKLPDKSEIEVPVSVTDPSGAEVFTAKIRLWVTLKPQRPQK